MTTTITQTGTRTVGALVRYHGSITSEHWAPFYIAAVGDAGRLTLIDRDYPNVTTLRQVRPNSVTPTGETIQLCGCGHEAGAARHNWSGHCELRGCDCWNHTEERTPMTTVDLDTILDIIGPVAYREFENAADAHRPALTEWILALPTLDDDQFRDEAGMAIHGSALVNSFRGNWDHEHCKASAAYHESNRRHAAAGHAEDCNGDTIYDVAFRDVWRSQGHSTSAYPPKACTCDAGGGRTP